MIFLIQSPHGWRDLWQRPHHLALRFARAAHRVRWVEPRYLRWALDDRERFRRARDECFREETTGAGVDVRAVTLINGERIPLVRRLNQRRLSRALRDGLTSESSASAAQNPNHARGSKHQPRVLWLYNPHEVHLIDSVPHDVLVYDIMDEYQGFPWSPKNIAAEEERLLARADWVFAGTEALYQAKRAQRGDRGMECVLSGVDVEHFKHRNASPADPPADLRDLRARYRKLIGYAGMIDLRIDQELIATAARRRPDCGFILLGAERCDTSSLRAERNIHLLGQKDYADLPVYYAAWDLALVPFVENELTRHVNPTKVLEYAAAGLPVVARALPDVERFYARGAFLYRTPAEFDAALSVALGENEDDDAATEALQKHRQMKDWLKERSWDAIAERMLRRVERLAAEKRSARK